VPLPAILAGSWPAITRRESPPPPLPRLPALVADEWGSRLVLATQKLDSITGSGTRLTTPNIHPGET